MGGAIMKNLVEQIINISNMDEFQTFLIDLTMDTKKNPDEWANTNVSDYLGQMASWIGDFLGCPNNNIEWDKLDFKNIAKILYMEKYKNRQFLACRTVLNYNRIDYGGKMSLYYYYSKVGGEDAFLAGTVSSLCDEKLSMICPRYWAVDADIFRTDKNNFCAALKKRLYEYLLEDDEKVIKHIDRLDFELVAIPGSSYENLKEIIDTAKEKHHPKEKMLVDEFCSGVEYQIGKELAVYKVKGGLNESNTAAISDFYTYIVFDILFVEYKEFMVMIVLGSDE